MVDRRSKGCREEMCFVFLLFRRSWFVDVHGLRSIRSGELPGPRIIMGDILVMIPVCDGPLWCWRPRLPRGSRQCNIRGALRSGRYVKRMIS